MNKTITFPWETPCSVCGLAVKGPVLPPRVTVVDRPRRPHRFRGCTNWEFDRHLPRDYYCGGMGGHWCIHPELPYRTDTFDDLREWWVGDTVFSPPVTRTA